MAPGIYTKPAWEWVNLAKPASKHAKMVHGEVHKCKKALQVVTFLQGVQPDGPQVSL